MTSVLTGVLCTHPGQTGSASTTRGDGTGRQTPTQDQSVQVNSSALMPKKGQNLTKNVKAGKGDRISLVLPAHYPNPDLRITAVLT